MIVKSIKSENDKILVHHGIKGQRWGVRRYQNDDGSLTDAGRKRYATEEAKSEYQMAKSEYNKKMRGFIRSGVPTAKHSLKNYNQKKDEYGDAFANMVEARARWKSSKYDDPVKKAKAEKRVYQKALHAAGQKWTAKNTKNYNVGGKLEEKLKKDKGEDYVKSLKSSLNGTYAAVAASGAAVGLGMIALGVYKSTKM